MPYVTITRPPRYYQITIDDILNDFNPSLLETTKDTKNTFTYYVDRVNDKIKMRFNFDEIANKIISFNNKWRHLIATEDKSTLYRSFKIPKRSGGLRQIDAPQQELMTALTELKSILEKDFYFTHHTAAFAYVQGRSTLDAVRRHQANKSRWILKTDLSKFFPHTTQSFLLKMLYQIFPLSSFVENSFYREEFEKAISLCFLNGGLPQGTPTSPMLTNQMMIPIDCKIAKYCHEHTPHLCYTRYADDMDFSSEYSFKWSEVVDAIEKILVEFDAPFSFNKEKTHYGSTSGRNWMLGVMLNKDGNITIGHENKKTLKTMLFAFGNAIKDNKPWSVEDAQHLQGVIAYYIQVEGDAIRNIITQYSTKFGFDLMEKVKLIIKGQL